MSCCASLIILLCLVSILIYISIWVACKLISICFWLLCGLISICYGVLCELISICYGVLCELISICYGVLCELIPICFWDLPILIPICFGVLFILIIYHRNSLFNFKIFRRNDSTNDAPDVENRDYTVILSVGKRLEELYGGKAHVGLRIPDPETGLLQSIDMVLVTAGKIIVISVKNVSGFPSINEDGSWSFTSDNQPEAICHPDPVEEVKKQASILESYLERRGIAVQEGCLSYKVIISNTKLRIPSNLPEVINLEQLVQLKPEKYKLNYIISTAPMRDRLELEGNKFVWGEYLKFKGESADSSLKYTIDRSKVSQLAIQKLTPQTLQVSYSPRDFRNEGALAPKWKQIRVKSRSVILFRPENSSKVHELKLTSIVSLSLSA